jgi:peptide subunit release factor RF-3
MSLKVFQVSLQNISDINIATLWKLDKGIDQLMNVAWTSEMKTKIIGTVGALQYEVIQYRIE